MKTSLTQLESDTLLGTLKTRFEENMNRHETVEWSKVSEKLKANPNKLLSLYNMEETGGAPDIVRHDKSEGTYIFFDCSAESPGYRRNYPYDRDAVSLRTKDRPKYNAVQLADIIGIEILNEEEYRYLQTLGKFDAKSSSWINTPEKITRMGGALFGDYQYDQIFIYHNKAQAFYASRGFRGSLKV